MAEQERFRLPKSESLRHKRGFTYLFEQGSSFRVGVLKFFYATQVPSDYIEAPVSVAFTAPKRSFKKAVTRNRLKRRMREAYRLQRAAELGVPNTEHLPLIILIKFQGRYEAKYARIARDMKKGLSLLAEKCR